MLLYIFIRGYKLYSGVRNFKKIFLAMDLIYQPARFENGGTFETYTDKIYAPATVITIKKCIFIFFL